LEQQEAELQMLKSERRAGIAVAADRTSSRRDLFKLAGAGVAGAAATAVLGATPVSATDNQAILLGTAGNAQNHSTSTTTVNLDSMAADGDAFDFNAHLATGTANNITGLTGRGKGNLAGVFGFGGGASGAGVGATGGAPNGAGVGGVGTGTGAGVHGSGGGASGFGVQGDGGSPNGIGVQAQGQGTGEGVAANGGGTSGTGARGIGGFPNGTGVDAGGQGTGPGVNANGGGSSGTGVQAQGGGPNGAGVNTFGAGSGPGMFASGGGSSGSGVGATGGGPNGPGINTTGAGTGEGLIAIGGGAGGNGAKLQGGGNGAPLNLVPSGSPGQPTAGVHSTGDFWVDSNGTVWVNLSTGTPGVWARLGAVNPAFFAGAQANDGGVVNLLPNPIRLLDTRSGAPWAGGSTHALQVTGTTDLNGSTTKVPAGALGVIGNVTAVFPQGSGDLRLFPHGKPLPTTSNLNYNVNVTIANAATVGLDGSGQMDIFVDVSTTHVLFDASGFVM
jgi:hypothetical protein